MSERANYPITGKVRSIQGAAMVLLTPQDDLNRQEFLALTAAILEAREGKHDTVIWLRDGRWEWARLAVPFVSANAYVYGPETYRIRITDNATRLVRSVYQLGESEVTPIPGKEPT
jgi:hypothetical protein